MNISITTPKLERIEVKYIVIAIKSPQGLKLVFQFISIDRRTDSPSLTFAVSQLILILVVNAIAMYMKSLIFKVLMKQKRYENPINLMILIIQIAEMLELLKQIDQQFFVVFYPNIAIKWWKCGYGVDINMTKYAK